MTTSQLLHHHLALIADKHPHRTALVFEGRSYTYETIAMKAASLACWLLNNGLGRGDRVALFMDNCAEQAISMFGVSAAGGAFSSMHGAMRASKASRVLNDLRPKFIIASASKRKTVQQALDSNQELKHISILWVGAEEDRGRHSSEHLWEAALESHGPRLQSLCPNLESDDLAFLIYTSGSTGEPKGVMCPHSAVDYMIRSINQYLRHTKEDRLAVVLPLSFGYGMYQILTAFAAGASVYLERSFMFLNQVLRNMEQSRATGIAIVPTIAAMAFRLRDPSKYDLSSLRYVTNAGAAMPVESVRRLRNVWPHASLFLMYGQTECQRISYLEPAEVDRRPDSAGKPMKGMSGWIVNEDGDKLPPGETGELRVSGPGVMAGYWNDPELTSNVFIEGPQAGHRSLRTGDLFRMDEDGFLYFQGRKKEIIKSQGERVSPVEVENVILQIQGVAETAVAGLPDELLGETVHAFVVKSAHSDLSVIDIRRYCGRNLEPYMVPAGVTFVDSLPRTPNGKIDKNRLVAETS